MIELGLARISRLLRNVPITWKACHVAGTNGKGSVCAYTSAMLHASGLKCGRFTSPHLIDRWDCIQIEEQPVSQDLFERTENRIKHDNHVHAVGASEFEILTATAFSIFRESEIDVGVVEVGLGGGRDATNVLESPLVTVVTKIGLDHQDLLGTTLEEIATEKAGIMKPDVPCVIDGSNDANVRNVLKAQAAHRRVSSLRFVSPDDPHTLSADRSFATNLMAAPYQAMNACLSLQATEIMLRQFRKTVPIQSLTAAMENTVWPGRLQSIRLRSAPLLHRSVLLDGAHNPQAADCLGRVVDESLRRANTPVVWVIAMSNGRSPHEILREILRPGDSLVATTFGPVDGMPWVIPVEASKIADAANSICSLDQTFVIDTGVMAAVEILPEMAEEKPVVFAGSLYMISEILRAERQATE